jgi:hypothetical protein
MLDDSPGVAPVPTPWPELAFEEKRDKLYDIDIISLKSSRGMSKMITSEAYAGPEPVQVKRIV